MQDNADDPVDHQRTTLKHAGQDIKNTRAMPGLIAVGISLPAIFGALYGFATDHVAVGVVLALLALLLLMGGLAWLTKERRRVRRVEVRYFEEHPDADVQPPSS